METISYIIIIVVGVVAYLFGRRGSTNGRTTVDEVRESNKRTAKGLDDSIKRTDSTIRRSNKLKIRLDDSIERTDDIKTGIDVNKERLKNGVERSQEISDIVHELRQRTKNQNDSDDID